MIKLKNYIKTIVYFLRNIFWLKAKQSANILMYHSIGNEKLFFSVAPENFERQMNYLTSNKYNVISLNELYTYFKSEVLPDKTVIITFDDGYLDNYTNAFPVLKKYNLPATIFLTTGLVGKINPKNNLKILDWPEIKEMQNYGLIDFEPHTVNHPKLSKIDFEQAKKEIAESKAILEGELGKPCNFFAYPFGDFNQTVSDFVVQNFLMALSVKKGLVKINDSLRELKRNSIDSEVDYVQFKSIVNLGRF